LQGPQNEAIAGTDWQRTPAQASRLPCSWRDPTALPLAVGRNETIGPPCAPRIGRGRPMLLLLRAGGVGQQRESKRAGPRGLGAGDRDPPPLPPSGGAESSVYSERLLPRGRPSRARPTAALQTAECLCRGPRRRGSSGGQGQPRVRMRRGESAAPPAAARRFLPATSGAAWGRGRGGGPGVRRAQPHPTPQRLQQSDVA